MKVKSNYADNMLSQWPGSTAYVQESEGNTMMGGIHLMSKKVEGNTREQTNGDCGCWEERCGASSHTGTGEQRASVYRPQTQLGKEQREW